MTWNQGKRILLNLISHLPGFHKIYKIYLYTRHSCEAKYQLLINKRESVGLKNCNYPKGFIEYSNDMDDISENIDEYNPNKKGKILIVFHDMLSDLLSDKKRNPVVTKLYLGGRKLNINLFLSDNLTLLLQNISD